MADVSLNAEFRGNAAPLIAATKEVGSATNAMHRQMSGAFADAGRELDLTDKKITGLSKSVAGFGSSFVSIASGFLSAGVVRSVANAFLDYSDEVKNASERTGKSVEKIQEESLVAIKLGVDLNDLSGAFAKFNKNLQDPDAPKSFIQAMGKIGLTIEQMRAIHPDDVFSVIAAGLSTVRTGGERAAISMELFGRGGFKLLPLLNDYAKSMEDAATSGAILEAAQMEEADRVGDLIDLYKRLSLVRSASAVIDNPIGTAAGAIAGAGVGFMLAGPVGAIAGGVGGAVVTSQLGSMLESEMVNIMSDINGPLYTDEDRQRAEYARMRNNMRRQAKSTDQKAADDQYKKDNAEYQKGVTMIADAQEREVQRHAAGLNSNQVDQRLANLTPMDIVWMGGAETAKAIITEQERAWEEKAAKFRAEGKRDDEIEALREKEYEAQQKITAALDAAALEEQRHLAELRSQKSQEKAESMLFKPGTQPENGGPGKLASTKSILDKERAAERAAREQQRDADRFQRLYDGAVKKQEHGLHLSARERWALTEGQAIMGQADNAPGLQLDNVMQDQLSELKQIRAKIDHMSGRTFDGEG